MTGLTLRSRRILYAAVSEYIATGQPVGSRTLSRKYDLDLSPASIRNVLADLEEAGYLTQPHASAGRVPTDLALRAFIDALKDFHEVSSADRRRLREQFVDIFRSAGPASDTEILRQAGTLVSELAGAAAVIASSPVDSRKLQQLRFMRIQPARMLAVLVFSDGSVENRYVDVGEGDYDTAELERVHNLLIDVVEGRSLGDVRDIFIRRLADGRVQVDELRQRAYTLAHQAVQGVGDSSSVVIAGRARLMELPEYEDVERLRNLIRALEEREQLVELLDKTLDSGAVTVYVGTETGEELGHAQLSLIVAPFGHEDRRSGTGALGVLGPTRMDYARLVPLVGASAAALTAALKDRDKS
ncbi:MAG: heat-inducible transcriptional repressor HrcA [Myxococcota bacterium]